MKKSIFQLCCISYSYCTFHSNYEFASSFISLCLLSMFHVRFLKYNSLFSNFLIPLCLALSVYITVHFYFTFSAFIKFEVFGGQVKNIYGSYIMIDEFRNIYYSLSYNHKVLKRNRSILLKPAQVNALLYMFFKT